MKPLQAISLGGEPFTVYTGLIVLIANIIVAFAADLVTARRAVPVLFADSTSRRLGCVIYDWLMTGPNKSSCQ